MRHRYHESPNGAREESLRRVSRLTWRTGQLGVLATVGVTVMFARTAPAPAANVQPAPTTLSAAPTDPGYPTVAATQVTVKPQGKKGKTSTRPAASGATTRPAGQAGPTGQAASTGQPTAPQTDQASAPTYAPSTQQAPAPAWTPSPTLAPPTTAPAPAPPSSAPAPTVSSTSHGGG